MEIWITYRVHCSHWDMIEFRMDIAQQPGSNAMHSFCKVYDLDFLQGQLMHIGFSWNKAWGNEPFRIYIDGVEVPWFDSFSSGDPALVINTIQKYVSAGYPYKLQLHKRDRRRRFDELQDGVQR